MVYGFYRQPEQQQPHQKWELKGVVEVTRERTSGNCWPSSHADVDVDVVLRSEM